MCLVFYTSTRLSFISPMSAALSCLPYITLPSLNGSLPPDDDDDANEQGKNMSPYLIHTGNWQRNCRKEGRKKARSRSKARSPKRSRPGKKRKEVSFFCLPFFSSFFIFVYSKFGFTYVVCDEIIRSVFLSVCLSVCLSICLSVCLFVYLSVCLSICLFFLHKSYLSQSIP